MKKIFVLLFFILCGMSVFCHFQLIYTPSAIIEDSNSAQFLFAFTHPAGSGYIMDIGKNEAGDIKGFKEIYSIHRNKKTPLNSFLEQIEFSSSLNSASAYTLTLNNENGLKGGGDWVIVAVPHPYYESDENMYIQQISKTIINKDGMPTDWQKRCAEGYPEIMPLVKPYEITAGGLFRGTVIDSTGAPVPHAKIEFEYMNYDIDMEENKFIGDAKLKNASAGVLSADHTGVFSFIPPRAGYWGFAAIDVGNEKKVADKKLSQDAVLWINVIDSIECRCASESCDMETAHPQTSKIRKEFSPAALVIVILLFAVLFAWPPVFKKMTEKKQTDTI